MKLIVILFVAASFLGCNAGIKPIEYGHDECYYCTMSIVEQQYGAELITDKGKIRKFDAVECMVNFIHKNPELKYDHLVVNVFDKPGELLDVHSCIFLQSESLPSPMGANLIAFSTKEKALEMKQKVKGELYTWQDLLDKESL